MTDEHTVNVRVIAMHNPPEKQEIPTLIFGMQDKKKHVHPGEEKASGEVWFECQLRVKQEDGQPNFLGDFAHGTPAQRFLYLSLGYEQKGAYTGIKRWKIHLASITWVQVEQALTQNATLQARIEGTGAASVPLLDDGWLVV